MAEHWRNDAEQSGRSRLTLLVVGLGTVPARASGVALIRALLLFACLVGPGRGARVSRE